jgi:hypothetical protein
VRLIGYSARPGLLPSQDLGLRLPAYGFGKPRGVAADRLAYSMLSGSEVGFSTSSSERRELGLLFFVVVDDADHDADQNSQPR